jgi:hypothetical protein
LLIIVFYDCVSSLRITFSSIHIEREFLLGTILGHVLLISQPNSGLPEPFFHGNQRVNAQKKKEEEILSVEI